MQSIILIGDEGFNIDSIIQVKHNNSINEYTLNTGRYVVEFEDGHVYYDYDKNLINDYDEYELNKIPFISPNFICMTYTSEERLKNILQQNNFLKGIYIDNDYGLIIPIEEFVRLGIPIKK